MLVCITYNNAVTHIAFISMISVCNLIPIPYSHFDGTSRRFVVASFPCIVPSQPLLISEPYLHLNIMPLFCWSWRLPSLLFAVLAIAGPSSHFVDGAVQTRTHSRVLVLLPIVCVSLRYALAKAYLRFYTY
jgi:hypothetical protein